MWQYIGLYVLAMIFTAGLWILVKSDGNRLEERRRRHWTRKD